MPRRDWTRDELILAMNLYCQLPFGRMHQRTPEIVALAGAIGRTPSSVAMKLTNLASLDPFHQQRGIKGLSAASAGDRRIWQEFHDDWERLSAESEALRERFQLVSPIDGETNSAQPVEFAGATEGVSTVKVRRAQRFFRRSVLASYESRCCVTAIAIPELLIASHILPWSTFPEHRADPRNGLCLSRLHDGAFDQGLITFDEEFRLVLSPMLRDATTNGVLRHSFAAFEGQPLRLPNRFRPPAEYLARHREDWFRS
ncbi:MAG: HNH endonuclease [Planctomycetaceae bacterium]|nr:HNH endonuclease [Planctomycetaceae bacterium]